MLWDVETGKLRATTGGAPSKSFSITSDGQLVALGEPTMRWSASGKHAWGTDHGRNSSATRDKSPRWPLAPTTRRSPPSAEMGPSGSGTSRPASHR
jgi:hypothetical protein